MTEKRTMDERYVRYRINDIIPREQVYPMSPQMVMDVVDNAVARFKAAVRESAVRNTVRLGDIMIENPEASIDAIKESDVDGDYFSELRTARDSLVEELSTRLTTAINCGPEEEQW